MNSLIDSLSELFDRVGTEENRKRLETTFVKLAVGGFLLHLATILFVRLFPELAVGPFASLGTNFMQAVYTPFSFILFYEVLLLVFAIPGSLTSSICKQYEIISLIVVRRVFKDIGSFNDISHWVSQLDAVNIVLLDMGGALLMFLAVTLFYLVRTRVAKSSPVQNIEEFIKTKKAVAIVLGIGLVALAIFSFASWITGNVFQIPSLTVYADVEQFFFPAFFEFMIFTDVLILILSISYYDRYEYLFRNSGFVISTVLLRVSLSTSKPFDLAVAVIAVFYGLALITIFAFFTQIQARKNPENDKHVLQSS